jgi:ribonuclease P protein component
MVARLVRSADFERVLRTRSQATSAHFAVHHVAERPSMPVRALAKSTAVELSTVDHPGPMAPVDDSPPSAPDRIWLGAIAPKRHARRAVTRSLLKRQIRAVVANHAAALSTGLWVVRLRAPFDRTLFTSAASGALGRVVREELEALVVRAPRRSGVRA